MDLRYTAPEQAFRRELRDWLAATLPGVGEPPPHDDWPARRAYDLRWQRLLFDAGYAGVDWPSEGGGRGASPVEQLIFKEECERAGAPYVGVNFVGLLHAGPTIIAEGTAAQRGRYLPAILRGEEVWCQGFSEPDAGSDLASLRTRAVRDGDDYVVTGSKIWTSHAEVADFCELLVRTGEERTRGITWLIMPMDAPGIEIRPLRTIAGTTEFAELFLNEVRVPVANRVGDENDGWRVTMVTLSFERGTAFVGELLECMRLLGELARLAERFGLMDDAGVARRIGHLVAAFDALWALTKRNVSEAAQTGIPGIGGSVFKLSFSEHAQALGELAMELLDRAALCADPLAGRDGAPLGNAEQLAAWFKSISSTIAAGTSQVQRNIVAERILGLPKAPALMDFRVGEDQHELAAGIRAMVAGRLPLEHLRAREGDVRAISDDDWAALGETGVFALTLPEPVGTGLTMAEAVVVFEELGRALVPGPLIGTFLAARAGLVEGAAEGRAQVGVHCGGPGPVLVEHLGALDALLVFAVSGGGMTRLLVPAPTAGATRMEAPLDPLTPLWRLDSLPPGAPLANDDGSLFRDGALLTAALQVGHAAEALDLAVAYAKERQQFGTPIGTFQAIKHMCADMLVRAEVARAAVHAAACLADQADIVEAEAAATGCTPEQLVDRAVGGAKLLADDAAIGNARSAIQVHGGMGFTWEVPLHLHLKRARVHATTFGTPAERAAGLAAYAGAPT